MNANYQKGVRREYRAMQLLEACGYRTMRSAGSHGPFDVVGFSKVGIVLVQCKSNSWPSLADQEVLRDYPTPANTLKLIYRFNDRTKTPLVREVQ